MLNWLKCAHQISVYSEVIAFLDYITYFIVLITVLQMLNGELKQLYTAITRARVNLWIFDENRDKRDPAFKYFIRREFVQVVKTDENKGKACLKTFYKKTLKARQVILCFTIVYFK